MIHVNQKGYSAGSGIRAVYQSRQDLSLSEAWIVDAFSGEIAGELEIGSLETVPGWKNRYFQILSLGKTPETGRYRIAGRNEEGRTENSENFSISSELIAEKNLFDLLVYFKGMRSDG
ncbi:MAG: hypothetical protein PQJ58_08615, partial [Spirochaetales bacterium]|nr:hypothetical protein [Spirochaetales bacterium]